MGIVLIVVTFSQQNTADVPIRYFSLIPNDFKVASYLLIFLSFFVGVLLSGLIGIIERFRLTLSVSKLKKQIKVLEKDITESKKQIQSVGQKSTNPPLGEQNLR
jgi:uncharacterized membrane protein YciS (DUF1049 family)